MHTRQSGAAHVPIMFFLILLVMFLGALGYAYVVTDANTNLRTSNSELNAQIKAIKGKTFLFEHYIEDLGNVLQVPGAYSYRDGVSADIYENQSLDGVSGVTSPRELRTKIDNFGRDLGLAATNGVEDLFAAVASKVSALQKRITDIEHERDTMLAQKNATDTQFAEATASHSRAGNEWRQTLEQTNRDFEAAKSNLSNQIGLLQTNVKDKDASLAEEKESRAAERKQLNKEIGRLQMHNTALVAKDRMRHPPSQADGKVVVAKTGLPTAYIDLGKKDMLQPGTMFQIKNPNDDAVKAYATVTRVDQERSEVQLSGVVDSVGDPVRDGDLLYNELYSPGASSKRTIYLLGRFSYPYHKPQLEALLRDLGNTVVANMGPGVDTVLLGDDAVNEAGDGFTKVEESEEYKLATALGVEFVPMRKVRDIVRP
ncbi:MAG: hypothetical protein AB7O97_23475 [Planctomycetota bacterium]